MSKKKPEWLAELEDIKEKADDPVVDGLVHIGNHVTDQTDMLDSRIDRQDERMDEQKRNVAKQGQEINDRMEQGFKMVSERLDSMRKRDLLSPGAGGGSVFSAGDRLVGAIPEEHKHLVYQAELAINTVREGRDSGGATILGVNAKDPVFRTMSSLWTATALKLQLPRRYGGRQAELKEELDRYERAFNDVFPVPEAHRKAAYAEGSDATGGYLVPSIVAAEILRIVQDSGVVVSRARHIPMSSNQLTIPNEATGVTVYWSAEAALLTGGEGTFGQNILDAKKLIGRASASIEAIEDSVVGLIPYIQTVMGEAIGKELDQEALEGTGTNFTGLNAESGINTVATTTTNGEALTFADLVQTVYAADESSVEDGAAWFMHRKVFATVVNLVDSNGRPIFHPNVTGAPGGTILGFPVYTTSAIATTTTRGATSNTTNIYFGDPRRLIFGDRSGLRFEATDTGPGWENYQIDMRLVGRWGFTVGTPGAFSRLVGCTLIGA